MGTDIYGYAFIHLPYPGPWDSTPLEDDRNYDVFGMLAGIRRWDSDVPAISEPRGFASLKLAHPTLDYMFTHAYKELHYEDEWYGDHSYSWVTVEEVLDWPHWDDAIDAGTSDERTLARTGRVFRAWCQYLKARADGEPCILVFGFDS